MNNIDQAIKIADQLQKDIEKYYLEQNKIISELKETLEKYMYPDYPEKWQSDYRNNPEDMPHEQDLIDLQEYEEEQRNIKN